VFNVPKRFSLINRNLLPIVSLAIASQILFAQSVLCNPQDAVNKKLERLDSLVQRGKSPAALPLLEHFTREYPQSERGWLLLNKAYLDVDTDGQGLRMAITSMKKAISMNKGSSALHKALGELYARDGKFELALKSIDRSLNCTPQDPFCYKSRARVLLETKRDKEAVSSYERYIQLHPERATDSEDMELGGLCYQRAGQPDKAIKIYDALWARNKSLAWPLKKAECYVQLGKSKEAIDVYSLVIKESPNDEIALLNRGKLHAKLGHNKEAMKDFSAAIVTTPTSSIFLERAKIYDKLGKPDLAKRDREKANASNDGW